MSSRSRTLIYPILLGLLSGIVGSLEASTQTQQKTVPKNIILMIGDGMGPAQINALRHYLDDPATESVEPLLIDQYLIGTVRTAPKSPYGQITDSAAAATALATGKKVENGVLSLDTNNKTSLPTLFEKAFEMKKQLGLVVTSQINHATPAAFVVHIEQRSQYKKIAKQMVEHPHYARAIVDVMLGGGTKYFSSKKIERLKQQGYAFVKNKKQLEQARQAKIIGLFAKKGLPMALDRTDDIPSLAEMTQVALARLRQNKSGFLLMIEGSQIDWAAHDNDVVGMLSELQDFYEAFKVARAFAMQNGETLLMVTADHATGGFSMGRRIGDVSYYQWRADMLRKFIHTPRWIAENAAKFGSVSKSFAAAAPGLTLPAQQQALLDFLDVKDVEGNAQLLNELISALSYSGWTTKGHTGVDVNLYAFGPGAELFRGNLDNTEVGARLMQLVEDK